MKAQLLFERKLKVVRKEPLGYRTPTEVHVYPDPGQTHQIELPVNSLSK